MGLRGPAPAPTAVKVLKGERKDRINFDGPEARVGCPIPPDDLSRIAKGVWDYTVKELLAMGVLTLADRDALVSYCEAVATHRRASSALAVEDLLVNTERGYVKNPLIQVQRDSAVLMKQFAAEFGLTPRSRSEFKISSHGGDVRDGLLS